MTKIAMVLNVPLDDLIDSDIKKLEDKYTFDILRKTELLSVEEKIKVLGYIDRILDENGVQVISIK